MSIKEHIIENFKNDSVDAIMEAITSSCSETDEVVLPGLGVMMGILWKEADQDLKKKICEMIRKGLDHINS